MDIGSLNYAEALEIYNKVRRSEYPPTNIILLSKAQYILAKKGETKKAGCIAQWVAQLKGVNINYDDWLKVCEI